MFLVLLILTFCLAFTPQSYASGDLFDRQLEVFDVTWYGLEGPVGLEPLCCIPVPEPPVATDADCDGDARAPTMREPHDYKSTCDSTASWYTQRVVNTCYS